MSSLAALAVAVALGTRLAGADVEGVVRDESTAAPVAGAVVSLDDLGRSTVTDAEGRYRLPDIPPGPQHLSVRVLGFQPRSLHVLVPAQGSLRVDLLLRTRPIEVEAVVVRSRIPLRGVESDVEAPDPARTLSGAAIRNDPFAAEPDVLGALVGGLVAETPESGGGLYVRGGDADEVGYLLDGVPVFSPYHSGLRSGAWSPDAVAGVELRADPTLPADGLAGSVLVTTVEPGDRLRGRAHASTSQVGGTARGPFLGSAGFVVSGRLGFPGLVHPPDEPSYLDGRDHDLLARFDLPAGGSTLRLLAFDNRNVVEAASRPSEIEDVPTDPGPSNRYEWHGRTLGALWEDRWTGAVPTVRVWHAALDAFVDWNGEREGRVRVEADRSQIGGEASVAWDEGFELGARFTHDATAYSIVPEAGEASEIEDRGGDFALIARATRDAGSRVRMDAAVVALWGHAGARVLPRLGVRAMLGSSASVFAEYARAEQSIQSLRNAESVVGRIFPAELFAPGTDIPTARSDRGTVGLVLAPWPGARFDLEGYARTLDRISVPRPEDGRPFSSTDVAEASGHAAGVTAGITVSSARYAVIASSSLERVSLRTGDVEWTPGYAAARTLRLGAVAFPTPSLSLRVGWTGQFGRTTSDVVGAIEWESCNLLDRGCEFAGSPEELGPWGERELPSYQRLDATVRKHWHLLVGGREASLEVFATATNLLGNSNVLGYTVAGAAEAPIEMRPRAPLTLGIGWGF